MDGKRFIDRRTELPEDFYSTSSFTDRLIKFLDDRTTQEKEKPFFACLAYTAPHWPLQAPRDIIDKYGESVSLDLSVSHCLCTRLS